MPGVGYSTSPQSLTIYRQIREAIASGEFQPNERLVEADLVERFDASRSSVRTALLRLSHEGLVVHEPHRGARVRLVSDQEAVEISETRGALERLAAREAALKATQADIERLREIIDALRVRLDEGDLLGYSEVNGEFHDEILRISRHETAARMLSLLKSHSIRFQYKTILRPGRAPASHREHVAIFEAIAQHDPDAVEVAVRTHFTNVVATLRAAVEQSKARRGAR